MNAQTTGFLRCSLWLVASAFSLLQGCTDAVPADGRPVFLVASDLEVVPIGGTLRLYGSGLAAVADSELDQNEIPTPDVDITDCRLPESANEVLFDGTAAEVCYRATDRIDLRVPVVSPGAHYVVVRSGGQLSNAIVVYVTQ